MSLLNIQAELVEALVLNNHDTDLVVPAAHLAIYRNNISASLIKALKNTYPMILALVGEEFFVMTAKEYIRQYPSRSGNLHQYGEYFSHFLASYPPVHELIYLAEVAEFEWASHIVYHAANHPPFVQHSLDAFTPEQYEQLRFILHPASWLHKFHFPILEIAELCQSNQKDNIDLHHSGVNLLIIRRELDISLIALEPADFTFLETLQQNKTLMEALHAAHQIDADYPLEEKLPAFIQDKILVDCYLADESEPA